VLFKKVDGTFMKLACAKSIEYNFSNELIGKNGCERRAIQEKKE